MFYAAVSALYLLVIYNLSYCFLLHSILRALL